MSKKNLLLILPKYFGYEKYIKKEFENKGYSVKIIYENIDNISIWYRFVMCFLKSKKDKELTKYYRREMKTLDDKISKVVVIHGSTLTQNVMNDIKHKWPNAKLIMYQWDSVKNNPNAIQIAKFFDKKLTFDMDDAEEYGWDYRPLFYIPELCSNLRKNIDFTYICFLHSNRVKIFNKLKMIKEDMNLVGFMHIFMFKLVFFRHKYLMKDPIYKEIRLKDVSFNELTLEETNQIYDRSKIIIDFTHPDQKGYTMRTIESLGHKCKLITNNEKIKEADFYDKNNMLVYQECDVIVPRTFLDSITKNTQKRLTKDMV